jgi:hypothetical protein
MRVATGEPQLCNSEFLQLSDPLLEHLREAVEDAVSAIVGKSAGRRAA